MRNEAAFWSGFVKPALNYPPASVAWKIPAEIRKGLPDVWWSSCNRPAAGWLELKYLPAWPKRNSTPITIAVSVEQLAHLRAARAAGSWAAVLLGVADEWFLLDPNRLTAMWCGTRTELMGLAENTGYIKRADQMHLASALTCVGAPVKRW